MSLAQPLSTHLLVGHQQQTHERGVEDRLRDVRAFRLEAVVGHQRAAQGLARVLRHARETSDIGPSPSRYSQTHTHARLWLRAVNEC